MKYEMTPAYRLVMERTAEIDIMKRPSIGTPIIGGELALSFIGDANQEHFITINLDVKNRPISVSEIYIGSLSEITIKLADIFRAPLIANASSFIIAHNHPSGDTRPSPEDVKVTELIKGAGKLMDLPLMDSLIVSSLTGRIYSLREHGLGGF